MPDKIASEFRNLYVTWPTERTSLSQKPKLYTTYIIIYYDMFLYIEAEIDEQTCQNKIGLQIILIVFLEKAIDSSSPIIAYALELELELICA